MRALLALALLAGCFSPSYHDGGFLCSMNGNRCPEGFHCAADNACWRDGHDPTIPDGGALPDLFTALPDARPPEGGWVSSGGISTAGAAAANSSFKLGDNGLEISDVSCNASFCVTGGITP